MLTVDSRAPSRQELIDRQDPVDGQSMPVDSQRGDLIGGGDEDAFEAIEQVQSASLRAPVALSLAICLPLSPSLHPALARSLSPSLSPFYSSGA